MLHALAEKEAKALVFRDRAAELDGEMVTGAAWPTLLITGEQQTHCCAHLYVWLFALTTANS